MEGYKVKFFANMLLLLFLISGAVVSHAEPRTKFRIEPGNTRKNAEKTPEPATIPLNPVTTAIQKQGVINCLGIINQVTDIFISGNQKSGVALAVSPKNPNTHLVSISLESQSPTTLSYTNSVFSPTPTGCGAVFESVIYWKMSCQDVASKVFGGLTNMGVILNSIAALQTPEGPQLRVYLMPAEKNRCITMRKEIIF
jgi:hypothetical protein